MATLIVYVQSDKQRVSSKIYDIIKKACDVKVGIRSIFVNRDTLATKSHDSPLQGPSQVVGSICRELRVRSPPMLMDMSSEYPNGETRNLVIGMHVKSFTSQTPSLLDDWTLRNRSPEMILVALVSRAVDSSADYHTEVTLHSKSDFEDLDVTTLFRKFFGLIKNSAHSLTVLRSGYLVDACTKKSDEHLAKEKDTIRKAYNKVSHHGSFTYATLREDKLLKGCVAGQEVTPQANKHNTLLITTFSARPTNDPSQPSGSPSNHKQQLPQPPADDSNDALNVTPPEVEIFGHIWKDVHLELYDIKWPIPTYLAQLASYRALVHVVTNDWDNQTEATPVYLPNVHKYVRDTLYYV
jgi:hypothetical protein